ncbi:GNAT family N-acetyltransferase [Afifella marina]|uniref:Acetyltransferase involved in cellulose biosynthesis, CelD/BcsL family n=1 Tax=Afifella marina DSM 2698 TaxID=1120955 RepID=A0A1G5N6N4_AFIMA|nr:GNAT family N-acetyltransferase [Afifella marina]SCZ32824.1 Acetyltransferase involved in cellulose biosynthesis, CelD/BcsL family [Afifella marina DSM 2698]
MSTAQSLDLVVKSETEDQAEPPAPTATPALDATIVEGPAALLSLTSDWQRLIDASPRGRIFQTPQHLAIWAEHFASDPKVGFKCVVVRRNGQVVLIWPLAFWKIGPLKLTQTAGAPVAQYEDILVEHKNEAASLFAPALAEMERAGIDLILMERVRADSALAAVLPPQTVALGEEDGAPFVDLSSGDVETALAGRKGKVKRHQKKRIVALAEEGELRLEVAPDGPTTRQWLREATEMKRAWLTEKGFLSRAFLDERTNQCLEAFAERHGGADVKTGMTAARLTVGGRPVATEIAYRLGGDYLLFLGAFAPEYGRFGPGNVLTEMVLRWCVQNGITRYDMLPPRYRNKHEWETGEVLVHDFGVPLSWRGGFYLRAVLGYGKPRLKRLYYALPLPLRSRLANLMLRL